MLRVNTNQARPGMALAVPVYHPKRRNTILLRPGVKLCSSTIARLADLGLPELWVQCPALQQLERFLSPELYAERAAITAVLADSFDGIIRQPHTRLDLDTYRQGVHRLITTINDYPSAALCVQELAQRDDPLLRHSANVCFLSLLMGAKLDFYLIRERPKAPPRVARDVAPLGVAGLLHDVGMLKLEPEVRAAWARDRDENDDAWRDHVHLGYQMVKGEVEPAAAAAILHHHQKFDGSGFPTKRGGSGEAVQVKGRAIHVFSRIIAVADLYERIRHPLSPTGRILPPVPAVRVLAAMQREPIRHWIDPIVFRSLLAVTPAYPPGSRVTLTDGREAVVAAWDPAKPCRPMVRPLIPTEDDLGFEVAGDGDTIDLSDPDAPMITEVDGVNVLQDNFDPAPGEDDEEKGILGNSKTADAATAA